LRLQGHDRPQVVVARESAPVPDFPRWVTRKTQV
jgi:hypothetical protein